MKNECIKYYLIAYGALLAIWLIILLTVSILVYINYYRQKKKEEKEEQKKKEEQEEQREKEEKKKESNSPRNKAKLKDNYPFFFLANNLLIFAQFIKLAFLSTIYLILGITSFGISIYGASIATNYPMSDLPSAIFQLHDVNIVQFEDSILSIVIWLIISVIFLIVTLIFTKKIIHIMYLQCLTILLANKISIIIIMSSDIDVDLILDEYYRLEKFLQMRLTCCGTNKLFNRILE